MTRIDTAECKHSDNELSLTDQIFLISRTANALAHEIKTPLTSIKLNVEMLDEDNFLSENKRKSLSLLKKEIGRLSAIVDSYLNISRQNNLELSKINFSEFIEEIKSLLAPELNKRNIVFKNRSGQFYLMADRDKLKSVFLNLIKNSIEAIGENGNIEISSLLDETHGLFKIFIKDDGRGIEDCGNIFKPFYTTKNTGNGLGLVLASEILRKHNGSIKLNSSVPGKTVFEISFSL